MTDTLHDQSPDDEVYVRVLVCYNDRDEERPARAREYMDCPVRVWLDKPPGQRAVIDVDRAAWHPKAAAAPRDGRAGSGHAGPPRRVAS